MKTFILIFTSLISFYIGQSQTIGELVTLKGYIIVSSFKTSIKSGCTLNIKTTKSIAGDSMTCGDGNFYKNISVIKYVKPENLDLNKIDNFNYQIRLQKDEHFLYLSTNPLILLEASKGDSAILKKNELIEGIQSNQITADSIQNLIDKLNLDFKKKRHYYILMEVELKVMVLPKRNKPKTFKDPCGLDQYVIIQDKTNQIKTVKIIIDPF